MAKRKELINHRPVCILLHEKQIEWVKHMARKMSVQEGKTYNFTQCVRMAIDAVYPMPKSEQLDMLKMDKKEKEGLTDKKKR